MTHEFIYDGNAQVGVRIFDKAEEVDPILRVLDNNPFSQMEIRLIAMSVGADIPGVWNWRSVGTDDTDVYIYWDGMRVRFGVTGRLSDGRLR